MKDLPGALTGLEARVEALEQRVAALEHPAVSCAVATVQEAIPAPVQQGGEPSFSITTGALSVFGRAMLGIAGAYLLRAVAEWNELPRLTVAAVAILYAIAWIAAASRAVDWLRGTTYACTSALILAPMLWELTVRFHILAAPLAAMVLGLYVVTASALGWKRRFTPGLWVSYGTAATIALALAIVTHELIPFVAVLLLMVLIAEYRVMQGNGSAARVLAALAADAGIWGLIYIYSGPLDARAEYPAIGRVELIAPGALLFLLFGTGVIVQTILRRNPIPRFEAIQATIAFLLAVCGVMYFGPRASAMVLGILCLALSGAGYAATLKRFDLECEPRNSLVFATWSGALFVAGSLMGLPAWLRAAWLGLAAPMAVFAGARMRRPALELHGAVFLLIAATISGLLLNLWGALASTMPGTPTWGIYLVSICTLVCYAASVIDRAGGWKTQAISIIFASLASAVAAALLVEGLVGATAVRMNVGAHHLAFFRTLTVCAVATGLAYGGSRWRRKELTRVAYAALVLLVVKLLVEDLRHGHLAFVAGSIFLFAVTLIAIPRVGRVGAKALGVGQQVSRSAS